jgi:hypothetical protein
MLVNIDTRRMDRSSLRKLKRVLTNLGKAKGNRRQNFKRVEEIRVNNRA